MRLYRRQHSGACRLLALALLAGSAAWGQTDDPQALADDYAPGDYGRIRYEENGMTILRAETEAMRDFPTAGLLNAPIFPGDAVTTNDEQRAEIQLAGGSLVRIDHDSQAVFLALSDPYSDIADNTVIQLAEGAIRLESVIDDPEEFRVDTPACAIYLVGNADIRVEVRGDRTIVASRRGIAEVDTGRGSLVVRGGMATEVTAGLAPRDSKPFNTFLADDFDRWVADREAVFAVESAPTSAVAEVYEELPAEVQPYYRELSAHGDWVRADTYGQVWIPRTTSAGWRPYGHGRWAYGPRGYFWVSHEPWGWAPYHYGRWTWIPGFGWSWVPGRVFGGAWVSWSWGPNHVGWCALDYWNRPALRAAPTRGVYDQHTWTFVSYEHFSRVDSVTHHVTVSEVSRLEEAVVVRRAPRVAPSRLTRDEDRKRLLAEVRADSGARVPVEAGDRTAGQSRSFVESERTAGLERTSLRRGETVTGGTTAPTQPSVKRTLVRSEQDKLDGASERWKDIYRKMSRPRPTQLQTAPETPDGTDGDDAARKPPARQSRGSRPPDDDEGGRGSPSKRRSTRLTGRDPTHSRVSTPVQRQPIATTRRGLSSSPRTVSSPSRPALQRRTVTAPRPRPAVATPSVRTPPSRAVSRPASRKTVAPATPRAGSAPGRATGDRKRGGSKR